MAAVSEKRYQLIVGAAVAVPTDSTPELLRDTVAIELHLSCGGVAHCIIEHGFAQRLGQQLQRCAEETAARLAAEAASAGGLH